ncbi:hypothetical protein BDF22DRAFT_382977 [Syncephalis plumigaleata]|nr:hypothetical protein BDF22DRAFT_382977 [Syncephalis plumigaleata]
MSVRNNLCGDNQVPDLTSEEQSLLGHRPSTVQNPFASLLSSACRPFRFIRRWQYDHRDYLAELFGTFLFVFLGLAVTAQYKLNVMDDCSNIGPFLIWGLALMIAIYACRHVSVIN